MISSKPIPQVFKDAERVRVKYKFGSLSEAMPATDRKAPVEPKAPLSAEALREKFANEPLTISDLLRTQNAERAVGMAKAVGSSA